MTTPCIRHLKISKDIHHSKDFLSSQAHFDYCSQIWHHCGARNTKKLGRVNERALRFVYKDKKSSYDKLLNWIGLHSTPEGHCIQDMLITINSCFQEKAPTPIVNLLKVKDKI